MKLINSTLDINPDLSMLNLATNSRFVFFDIETTGFVAAQTSLYLIGCIYPQDSKWQFRQWFLESHNEEPEVLRDFSEFLAKFDTIIHFNGATFDIPYMNKKYARYKQVSPFDRLESIDIYKYIFPYKKMLSMNSLKQKACEQFLGLFREDTFSGGDLIELYKVYTETFDEKLLKILLLHNSEDLTGMLAILPMMFYARLFEVEPEFVGFEKHCKINDYATLNYEYPFSIPVGFTYSALPDITLTFESSHLKMQVPIYSGELKFFYPNHKDYYYLPLEDCAMHKSVAQFVDKEYRTKATASNCYAKKNGQFIHVNAKAIKKDAFYPVFYKEYGDNIAYFEVPEIEDNKECEEFFTRYLLTIFCSR